MSNASRSITTVIVHGAAGRMGARLCELVHHDPSMRLVGAVARPSSPRAGQPAATASHAGEAVRIGPFTGVSADVVVDFSSDAGAAEAAEIARAAGASLLVGATALSPRTIALLKDESRHRAVLVAPNTSLGVAVAAKFVAQIAAALGPGYDISLVEAHHSAKKDAPSGTALRLAEAVRSTGATLRNDQILAVRGGDVIGEHTVRFAGPGEYLELTHRATSRDVFVRGAMLAAAWLKGQAPGWWTMNDVLGLSSQ